MLAVATGVYTAATPRLFLIDEPQAYLHPHAERSLLRLLDENPQHQYVIATHSAVFLNARPLSQARLITISEGASEIADIPSPEALLGEIGVTAADLWLSDAILWVEGGSDVAVLDLLRQKILGPPGRGIAIRAMPDASRFSSKNRTRAEQTFRFCEAVIDAVAPLPVRTLFLFDKNEKSDALCEEIKVASREKARFLPVRELENLFLEPDVIAQALVERCEALSLQGPSVEEVRAKFDDLLAGLADPRLYPRKPSDAESAVDVVVGSELLDRLYWEFSKSSYDKVADGCRLASLLVAEGVAPPAIRDVFEELMMTHAEAD
jgi:AAA domain, putative AbiEii toxin, Type IV TA system